LHKQTTSFFACARMAHRSSLQRFRMPSLTPFLFHLYMLYFEIVGNKRRTKLNMVSRLNLLRDLCFVEIHI
jgi:hypothetical protein